MRPARSLLLLALAAPAACDGGAPIRDQWTIYITTDAQVPQFGDRLFIQVFDDGLEPCLGCRRVVGLAAGAAGAEVGAREDGQGGGAVSFGVLPPAGGGSRYVRATLYRSEISGDDGLPTGRTVLSMIGRLPPVMGDTRVLFELRMDCFGVADPDKPDHSAPSVSCDPDTRALVPIPVLPVLPPGVSLPLVDPWIPGQPVPCPAGSVPPGMACVRGGAFLLGGASDLVPVVAKPLPERLVQLSPFALDVDEVTVGDVRKLAQEGKLTEEPLHREMIPTDKGACTYVGKDDPSMDAFPVNCVSLSLAREVCNRLGKRLPSEAEWEFAAGNGPRETPYPWGTLRGGCNQAIVQRGRQPIEYAGAAEEDSSCRQDAGDPWGPVAGGEIHDVTLDGGIRNMGGNLQEWVEDDFAAYDTSCWHPELWILPNPVCVDSNAPRHSVRGGGWALWLLRAFERDAYPRANLAANTKFIGFRCAKSF